MISGKLGRGVDDPAQGVQRIRAIVLQILYEIRQKRLQRGSRLSGSRRRCARRVAGRTAAGARSAAAQIADQFLERGVEIGQHIG